MQTASGKYLFSVRCLCLQPNCNRTGGWGERGGCFKFLYAATLKP